MSDEEQQRRGGAAGAEEQRCTCCGLMVRWAELEFVGLQPVEGDPTDLADPEPYTLELRNCRCGGTLARRVASQPPEGDPALYPSEEAA